MGKDKSLNPAEAHRKQERLKAIKKNKQKRDQLRVQSVLSKPENELMAQLSELQKAENEGKLSQKLKKQKQLIQDALNEKKLDQSSKKTKGSMKLENLYPFPEKSIYFHPVTNPYGAPPPGKPMIYIRGFDPENEEHILEAKELSLIPPPTGDIEVKPSPPENNFDVPSHVSEHTVTTPQDSLQIVSQAPFSEYSRPTKILKSGEVEIEDRV